MARSKSPSHVVEFPLLATPDQIHEVEVRFSFLRQLYNAALAQLMKRQKQLDADEDYQALRYALRNRPPVTGSH